MFSRNDDTFPVQVCIRCYLQDANRKISSNYDIGAPNGVEPYHLLQFQHIYRLYVYIAYSPIYTYMGPCLGPFGVEIRRQSWVVDPPLSFSVKNVFVGTYPGGGNLG